MIRTLWAHSSYLMAPQESLPVDPAQEIESPKHEAEKLARAELQVAKTTGDYKDKLHHLVEVTDDAEVKGELVEIKDKTTDVSSGFDDVKVSREMAGTPTQGVNHGLTTNTEVSTDVLDPVAVTTKTRQSTIIVLHERDEEKGHAGQRMVQALIDEKGVVKETEVILEGNVEDQTMHGEVREGRPEELYGEGQEFVERHSDVINDYVRKDGAHSGDAVRTQAEILKKSNMDADRMREFLVQVFAVEQVEEVIAQTRKDFHEGPKHGQESPAALPA